MIMKFKINRLLYAATAVMLAIPLTACSKKTISSVYTDKKVGFQLEKPADGEEIAIMHTSEGDIKIRFFPEAAPKAVENFKTHSKNGYYDGLTFHRVINDFMIQGGDPNGNGTGGESIWNKPFEDEFDSKLVNIRGSLAMANSGANTNGSQFFINQAPASKFPGKSQFDEAKIKKEYKEYFEKNRLAIAQNYGYTNWEDFYKASHVLAPDPKLVPNEVWKLYEKYGGNISLDGAWRASGGHTVFGQVFEGMDVVDAIAEVETDNNDKPINDVTIESIEIVEYKK